MRFLNIFYLAIIGAAGLLWYLLENKPTEQYSLYGFAESNETEINYNYPVIVDRILVTPGQEVDSGEVLMHIVRKKSREILQDQQYDIAELKAKEQIELNKKANALVELKLLKETKLKEMESEIQELKNEIKFKKSLSEGLATISDSQSDYKPLEEKLAQLKLEKDNSEKIYTQKILNSQNEIDLRDTPYRERIQKLNAQVAFEKSQEVIEIVVNAPSQGLIGNIFCKEEEHVPSYNTLVSFYEPHPNIVTGYIHEDLILNVKMGDQFQVQSLNAPEVSYNGVVIGLGSRIVEIPSRLRKLPDIKTYGREVNVEISQDNTFLQKEKVSLTYRSAQ